MDDFWKERSEKYNQISWVTDEALLIMLEEALELTGKEKVLCAGIGTGVLAKRIINKSIKVYGLDSSKEMIDKINDDRIEARLGDLKDMPFVNDLFDRVIFRNVLHHCVGYTSVVMDEALRVLKPGGKVVICEGIPMNNDCVSDFSQIVTLNENRVVFTVEDILYRLCDFKNISAVSLVLKQKSINNWLDNSVMDLEIKEHIYEHQLHTSIKYQKACNMTVNNSDILIDMKFLIARGDK